MMIYKFKIKNSFRASVRACKRILCVLEMGKLDITANKENKLHRNLKNVILRVLLEKRIL